MPYFRIERDRDSASFSLNKEATRPKDKTRGLALETLQQFEQILSEHAYLSDDREADTSFIKKIKKASKLIKEKCERRFNESLLIKIIRKVAATFGWTDHAEAIITQMRPFWLFSQFDEIKRLDQHIQAYQRPSGDFISEGIISPEIGIYILSFLSPPDLQAASLACKQFYEWAQDKALAKQNALSLGYDRELNSRMPQEYLSDLKEEVKALHERGLLPKDKVVYKRMQGRKVLDIYETLLKAKTYTIKEIYDSFFSSNKFIEIADCFATYLRSCISEGSLIIPKSTIPLDDEYSRRATLLLVSSLLLESSITNEKASLSSILFLLYFEPWINEEVYDLLDSLCPEDIREFDLRSICIKYEMLYCDEQDKRNASLILAVRKGEIEEIEKWLAQGVQLDARYVNQETILHHAIERGNLEVLEHLLKKEVNIEALGEDGFTPLLFAAWLGDKKAVELLIQYGADIHAKNVYDDEFTALHYAVEEGSQDIAEYLLKQGAEIEDPTPLGLAAYLGNKEIVELLLRYNADPNALYDFSYTFMIAMSNGHIELGRQLLALTDIDKDSAQLKLLLAIIEKDKEKTSALLREGVDANQLCIGECKVYSLIWTTYTGDLEIFKLLLDHGADRHIPTSYGNTLLHVALFDLPKTKDIALFLLEQGCDLDFVNPEGESCRQLIEEVKDTYPELAVFIDN